MTKDQERALDYPFSVDEIEFRIMNRTRDKQKGQIAAYVDARAIQNRLDEVVGRENWQNECTTITGVNGGETTHICKISIYYPDKKEWVSKSNGAGNTDVEPVKGGISNAFKRAASMWGLGRYLYEFKGIWAELEDGKRITKEGLNQVKTAYEKFLKSYLENNFESANPPKPNNSIKKDDVPPGRFSEPMKMPENAYKILAVKLSKSGETTMVSLNAPDGKTVSGYIKGKTELTSGQSICDLKVISKEDKNVGKYNIIESYKLVA